MSYTGFEWDEAKNRRNTRKHGLSFSTATNLFERPHLVHADTRHPIHSNHLCTEGHPS